MGSFAWIIMIALILITCFTFVTMAAGIMALVLIDRVNHRTRQQLPPVNAHLLTRIERIACDHRLMHHEDPWVADMTKDALEVAAAIRRQHPNLTRHSDDERTGDIYP